MKIINIAPYAGLVLLVWLVIGQYHLAQRNAQAVAVLGVQQICDAAHREFDGTSERACGDAQDRTHTEYLCSSLTPAARCWVEVK